MLSRLPQPPHAHTVFFAPSSRENRKRKTATRRGQEKLMGSSQCHYMDNDKDAKLASKLTDAIRSMKCGLIKNEGNSKRCKSIDEV